MYYVARPRVIELYSSLIGDGDDFANKVGSGNPNFYDDYLFWEGAVEGWEDFVQRKKQKNIPIRAGLKTLLRKLFPESWEKLLAA